MTPRNFRPAPPSLSPWRQYLFIAFLLLLFLVLAAGGPMRAWFFNDKARREAALIHHYQRSLWSHRGDIVDANGRPLAVSADVYEVRADMAALTDTPARREQLLKLTPDLADVLGVSADTLLQKFESGGRSVLLKRSLQPARKQALTQILRRGSLLHGFNIAYNSKRYYPQKEIAASVVGYTNHKNDGTAGIEFTRHSSLQSVDGREAGIRARAGGRLNEVLALPPQNGGNITLSIDSRLQFYAHDILQKAMQRHGARAAAAAVMDAQTGDVLALASVPGFNPNNIGPGAREKNHALTDAMEPGSLAKPFVVALALERGAVAADEMFPTDRPHIIGGVKVSDSHIDEKLDTAGILQKSSNIGAAMLAHRLGARPMWDLYRRLGFGGGKALGMPGEARGRLANHRDWGPAELTTHAYGYGFSATLMQLLAAYSIFAADGEQVAPRLEKDKPSQRRRAMSARIARQVRTMMEGAARPGGTAAKAAVPGYRVAGKTGTARKTSPQGGYLHDTYRAFFVGMSPASRPRYVAAVMIDEPRRGGYGGGAAAAPVFRDLMRQTLRLNGIPPDDAEAVFVFNDSAKKQIRPDAASTAEEANV